MTTSNESKPFYIEISNPHNESVKVELTSENANPIDIRKLLVIQPKKSYYSFDDRIIGSLHLEITSDYKQILKRTIQRVDFHGLTVYRVDDGTATGYKGFDMMFRATEYAISEILNKYYELVPRQEEEQEKEEGEEECF